MSTKSEAGHGQRRAALAAFSLAVSTALLPGNTSAQNTPPSGQPAPLTAIPSLDVATYLGTWYQVALYPNFFQKQCVSDTTATYRQRPDGAINVVNRCKDKAGQWDEAVGLARPTGSLKDGQLSPAQLQVSFLPTWLRWLPVGWGDYWVIALAENQRYAVISEASRDYLWILSRTPRLLPADEQRIRDLLIEKGFDLARLQQHSHSP